MVKQKENKPRMNIILDLDETLIHSFDKDIKNKKEIQKFKPLFKSKEMDSDFTVFARPMLQDFLDYLFSKYNVSVWTAASKNYALFIIKKFILIKPERKLDYILYSHHCDLSYDAKNASKDLSMFWDVWKIKGYNKHNTFIIDDKKEVYDTQPNNCIRAKAFKVENKTCLQDTYLKKIIKEIEHKVHTYKL